MFTAAVIAQLYDSHLCLHAGGVTSGERGLVRPGALRCGKSSLTPGLDRDTLTVHPYPRLINVRQESLFHVPGIDREYPQMRYGATYQEPRWFLEKSDRAAAPFSVDVITFPEFHAGRKRLFEISKSEALLRLQRSIFFPITPSRNYGHTAENLDVLSRVLERAAVYRLLIGNVAEALELLQDTIGRVPKGATVRLRPRTGSSPLRRDFRV